MISEIAAPRLKYVSPCLAKLDRLAWTAGISFRAYGLDIGVRVNDRRVLGRFVPHLPYGWKPTEKERVDFVYSVMVGGERRPSRFRRTSARKGPRRYHMLYEGMALRIRTLDFDELLERFESAVRLRVAEHARGRVFVHAGVVGWHGRAIVIPGRSFTGKTTLVTEFVRAGATYYSDEYAVLDRHGRVFPYLKPLSLRLDGDERQTHIPVEEIGGSAGRKPLPVGCILVTEFAEGATWRPRELTEGQAALALLANTVPARRYPETVIDVLQRVATSARTLKSKRGEAGSVVESILGARSEV
jgi:hypothetical protein